MLPILLALAAASAPACPAGKPALPPELSGWSKGNAMAAAPSDDAADKSALSLGQSADLNLIPEGAMHFAASPGRAVDAQSFAGLASLRVDKAGTYRVALDSPAWIDVVAGGKALESVNHSHGPECSGIGKMVDFALQPGRYLVQLTGSVPQKVRVMVTLVPAG